MDGWKATKRLNGLQAFGQWVHGVFVARKVAIVEPKKLTAWIIAHPEFADAMWDDMMDDESLSDKGTE